MDITVRNGWERFLTVIILAEQRASENMSHQRLRKNGSKKGGIFVNEVPCMYLINS